MAPDRAGRDIPWQAIAGTHRLFSIIQRVDVIASPAEAMAAPKSGWAQSTRRPERAYR
jgi:hypothetical protein